MEQIKNTSKPGKILPGDESGQRSSSFPAFAPSPSPFPDFLHAQAYTREAETAQMWDPGHRQLLLLPSASRNECGLNLTLLLLPAFPVKSESPGAVALPPAGMGQHPQLSPVWEPWVCWAAPGTNSFS